MAGSSRSRRPPSARRSREHRSTTCSRWPPLGSSASAGFRKRPSEHCRSRPVKLVLASRNAPKLRELSVRLAPHEVGPLPDEVQLPPETGETFDANARLKAETAARETGRPAGADD